MSYFSTLLDKDDRLLRIAVGEALALIFEIGNLEKFCGESKVSSEPANNKGDDSRKSIYIHGLKNKVLNQMRGLSSEAGGKGTGKKDLNNQRNTFREIVDFIEVSVSGQTIIFPTSFYGLLNNINVAGWLYTGNLNEDRWRFFKHKYMGSIDTGPYYLKYVSRVTLFVDVYILYIYIYNRYFLQLNFLKHFLGGGFVKHMQVKHLSLLKKVVTLQGLSLISHLLSYIVLCRRINSFLTSLVSCPRKSISPELTVLVKRLVISAFFILGFVVIRCQVYSNNLV